MEVLAQKVPLQGEAYFNFDSEWLGPGWWNFQRRGLKPALSTSGQLQATRSLEPECKPAPLGEELGCPAPPSFSSGRKGLRTI